MRLIIIILLFVLIFSKNVFAVTTTIDNFPSAISIDPFTVNVTISGASSGTNYLRIDLYKVSTTNYFGDTFNGSSWYNEGDHIRYYPITIQSGINWIGQIQGRFGNPSLTQYDGPGQYKIRVRRYTPSGSYTSSEAVDIIINVPISTPTPIITPTDAATPTETPMLTSATPTIAPTIGSDDPAPTENQTPVPTPIPQSYDNVYISEVMVNPVTGEKEWVEIYNNNDFPVSLNNWYIDDLENAGSSPKIFSLEISAKSYGVFDLTSSIFNNDGDNVRLLDFDKNLKNDFEYEKIEQGKSLGRTSFDTDNFCLQEPSKNLINNPCINPMPIITSTCTGQACLTPTTNITIPIIPKYMGRINPTPTTQMNSYSLISNSYLPVEALIKAGPTSPDVLGLSTNINHNNSSLINLLTILSTSYSLLTIASILIKSKTLNKYALAS